MRRSAEGGLAFEAAGRAVGMMVFVPRRRVLVMPSATIARVAASLKATGASRAISASGSWQSTAADGRHGDGLVNHFASERD